MNEKQAKTISGFIPLLLLFASVGLCIYAVVLEKPVISILLAVIAVVLCTSFTVIAPNQSVVITFFGRYLGTISESGFWAVTPFSQRKSISLRVRNFNSVKLKVNDVEGNPIEIAAVVVFKVTNSTKAIFEVESYEQFVEIQSETALRHVASKYPYDDLGTGGISLRGDADHVAKELATELQERLAIAGVEVVEARLTHLAYSTEIASVMLQRQQAAAIIAARQKIVEGAVGMVQLAIAQLQAEGVVELDEERKAAMINNLMVAIVSDRAAAPVINTGSIY